MICTFSDLISVRNVSASTFVIAELPSLVQEVKINDEISIEITVIILALDIFSILSQAQKELLQPFSLFGIITFFVKNALLKAGSD